MSVCSPRTPVGRQKVETGESSAAHGQPAWHRQQKNNDTLSQATWKMRPTSKVYSDLHTCATACTHLHSHIQMCTHMHKRKGCIDVWVFLRLCCITFAQDMRDARVFPPVKGLVPSLALLGHSGQSHWEVRSSGHSGYTLEGDCGILISSLTSLVLACETNGFVLFAISKIK